MFADSTVLQLALQTAVADVLGVSISSIEGLHIVTPHQHAGLVESYDESSSPLSASLLGVEQPSEARGSTDDDGDGVIVEFDVTSEYDASNTEETLIDSQKELMADFFRTAQHNNYTGNMQALQGVNLIGVSSMSLAPTPSPTEPPSASPTVKPSSDPTARPTTKPTYSPTSLPTRNPTSVPTTKPTPSPSPLPSPPRGSPSRRRSGAP